MAATRMWHRKTEKQRDIYMPNKLILITIFLYAIPSYAIEEVRVIGYYTNFSNTMDLGSFTYNSASNTLQISKMISYGTTISAEAHKQKECAILRGKLERRRAECLADAKSARSNGHDQCFARESNSAWSIGGGVTFNGVISFNTTYTIQASNLDQCILKVSNYSDELSSQCEVHYANNILQGTRFCHNTSSF